MIQAWNETRNRNYFFEFIRVALMFPTLDMKKLVFVGKIAECLNIICLHLLFYYTFPQ